MKQLTNLRALLALIALLGATAAVQAGTYTKADNTNSLDQAVSWGGAAPTATDIAQWSGTYSANPTATNSLRAVLPGSALAWQGMVLGPLSGTALTTNTIYAAITNISAATESGNLVTITTKANHAFAPGQSVTISGVTPSGYNGPFIVNGVPSATTFTFTNSVTGLAAGTAFGTVQSAIYIGGLGAATGSSALTIGTGGIDLSAADVSANLNAVSFAFSGSQTWNLGAGRVLHFGASGTGAANAKCVTSGNDGTITIGGSGIADLNQGGGTGFADVAGWPGFTGKWIVNSGATLRGLRQGTTAWGSSTASDAITLNGGTLAVGGISGDVGSWTWNSPITLAASTTSYIDDHNVTGTGRYLKLNQIITGSGNLVIKDTAGGAASTTFTSTDLGFILTGANEFSGTLTIGGPLENGIAGRLTPVRIGGNSGTGGTDVTTTPGNAGTLGTGNVVNNGVLTFMHTDALSVPNRISGTGTLRLGSLSSTYIGAAYQNITLSAVNPYTGPTVINAGTLALSAGASVANSSTIMIATNSINGGTVVNTLDVSALTGGFTTASGQTLNLNGGQIAGSLTCGAGSTNLFAPGCSNTLGTLTITGNLNLSGGTNTFVLDINNTANDQVSVGGSLTASGVTTLQFIPPGMGLNAGTYTLFTAANPVTAVPANFSIAGLVAGARPQTFSIAISGNLVQLVVVGNLGSLTWVGDSTANLWNTATTANWWNPVASAQDVFYGNDMVTFDDTGSTTPPINLVGSLVPGSVTVNASQDYTFGGAGQLAGSGGLTKSGTGKLTVTTSNSFTGTLLVNGGTLAITNETALGNPTNATANSLTLDGGTVLTTNTMLIGANPKRGLTLNSGGGTFNVTNASTLTLSNVIAGPGNTLTKTGNGTLVLAATNTHTLTVVNGGAVVCGTGYATGSAVSYTAGPTIQDGSVDINGCSSINISSGVNNYFINSTVTFGQKTGATSELKDTVAGHGGFGIWTPVPAVFYDGGDHPGTATHTAPGCSCGSSGVTTRQIQVGTSANAPIGLEITGVMGQTAVVDGQNATIEKTGDGVLKISNTNKFPGLKISGGKLIAGHVNALGSVRALANTVTVTGYGSTLDLNGFSPTVSDLEDGGSSDGTVLNNGATPSTLTLNHGTVVSTFSGTLANGSSPLALIKAGANTVTLSGVNTYTGGTAVSNGTLVVSGSLSAGSAVTVQSSATFSVNGGIVNRPVTINDGGNVSLPGTGTLANLTFVNTGNMSFNVANGGILTVTTPGGITNNGAANSIIIDITGTAPAAGTYTLIAYTGSLNGSGFNAYKLGTTPGGARFTLVHNPGVAVELTVAPAFLWTGAQTSEWSINPIAGLKNWAFLGSPLDYTNGAAVGFDDSLTGTSTVDISVANVTPASVAFGNTAINYTLQGSAAIAGTASLAKNGTGTLTLLNNNTYTGPTAVNEGVVQVGTNGSSGSLGSGPITLSTDLQFNRSDSVTVANNISGVGTLEQNGSGTLTLSGTNTATGITTVNAGTLVVTGGSAIADTATVAVNNPATFQVNTSETIGSLVVYPGATANANAGTLTASVVAMPGALTGSGTLTKIGTIDTTSAQFTTPNALAFNGTLRLRGSTPSTAPGSMQGATGRFWLGSPDGSQQPGTAFALDSGASRTDGQDLIIGDWDAASGNRSLTLSSLSGYGTIRTDSGSTGTRNLTVNQSGNTTFNGMLLSMYNGSALDRSIAFTKDGVGSLTLAGIVGYQTQSAAGTTPLTVTVLNGTLVLAATNTYTDPTTVSNGVLLVNGVLVSPVTVAGGSLGGTGVISAPVSVGNGGTLFTSKTGLGTLTISNALSFSAGSTNFTKVNAAASTSDLVQGFTSASYAGSMVVSNLSGTLTNGQSFPIFSAGGMGSFASITPAPGAGMTWNFNAASGLLSVASSTASNPTNISFSVSGSTMTLSWPADHLGWLLQAQTNSLSVGLGTNWVGVPGSDVVTSTNLPIVTGNPSVFYRLRHP